MKNTDENVDKAAAETAEGPHRPKDLRRKRQKIQRWVKRPVFIVVAFLLFTAWTLRFDEEASTAQFNTSLVSFVLLLALYYKMLTSSLDWVHGQLQTEDIKKRHNPTMFNNFIIYAIAALLPTLALAGLYLLIFYVLIAG